MPKAEKNDEHFTSFSVPISNLTSTIHMIFMNMVFGSFLNSANVYGIFCLIRAYASPDGQDALQL